MTNDSVLPPSEVTKQDIVARLEEAFTTMAEELGVPVEKVKNVAREHFKRLSKKERKNRIRTIIRLRKEGYSNDDIALELGISLPTITQTVHKLIQEGRLDPRPRGRTPLADEEHQQREEQVIRLRGEGHSNQAIAEALELSVPSITQTVHKLIQEGRVTPQRRGPKLPSDEERQEREEQIIRLREEGHSNEAIAEALGLSISATMSWVCVLLAEGLIARRQGSGFQRDDATWRDVSSERVQIIIRLKKQRATLEEIGTVLGVTRERARQLIKKIAAEHGEDVFNLDEPLWTIQEAAEELGVNAGVIISLCQQEEISYRRRSLSQDSMEALKRHPRITGERICATCKKTFIHTPGQYGGHIVCSDKCLEELDRVRREECLAKEPTLDSLAGWRRELWQRLQLHKPPKKEKWLTLSEACTATGLSKMQVGWIGLRRIVTIHRDPSRIARKTGEPMALYAASEMEIARQVYAASKDGQ